MYVDAKNLSTIVRITFLKEITLLWKHLALQLCTFAVIEFSGLSNLFKKSIIVKWLTFRRVVYVNGLVFITFWIQNRFPFVLRWFLSIFDGHIPLYSLKLSFPLRNLLCKIINNSVAFWPSLFIQKNCSNLFFSIINSTV